MGDVVAKIKVLPTDMEKFEELKSSLSYVSVMEEKPIAFGLRALEILVRVPDSEGGLGKIEKKLSGNKLISSYEILEIGRI